MKTITSSIWILYRSFFDVVPGQKGLLAIGFLMMLFGTYQRGTNIADVCILAGAAFFSAFTLIFAGPHFRKMSSFRRHRLIPHFRKLLIVSYLLVLVFISLVAFIAVNLLEDKIVARLLELKNMPAIMLWLAILSVALAVSLFGFLTRYFRYALTVLVVIVGSNIQKFSVVPIDVLLLSVIAIAISGLCCFIYFIGMTKKPIFYTKKAVSLAKYTPGLNGSFQEPGVTAVGSILLGMSDGLVSRFIRAFFTAFMFPSLIACAAIMAGSYSLEQVVKKPQILFFSLMTSAFLHIHFVFIVSARRRFIWLRIGGNQHQINQVAQTVLAKERWLMALCFGLWCVPVICLYPNTTAWLLGVSSLLWFMMLLIEQILLAGKRPLTPRVEFYLILTFIGLLASLLASAEVHQEPWIFWYGVLAMFFGYSVQKLASKKYGARMLKKPSGFLI